MAFILKTECLISVAINRPKLTYISHLNTHSMHHSPSWQSNQFYASKKVPKFHGTRNLITEFPSAEQLSLSRASFIHSLPPYHFLKVHFNIILPSSLCLPSALFPSKFPHKTELFFCLNLKCTNNLFSFHFIVAFHFICPSHTRTQFPVHTPYNAHCLDVQEKCTNFRIF
jgi:hypothetical protein